MSSGLPSRLRWLFWNVDFNALDPERDANTILARVLERGRLEDVRWAMDSYGLDKVHAFFRDTGHPELTARTIAFWRVVLDAEEETWASTPEWRQSSSAPWIE